MEPNAAAVVFLAFTMANCAPCKQFKDDFATQENVEIVDSASSPELVADYKIKSYPTIVALKDGVEVDRTVGYTGKWKMQRWMNKARGDGAARRSNWAWGR